MKSVKDVAELERFIGKSLSYYYPAYEGHYDGIYISGVAVNLVESIKNGDSSAIEIGCQIIVYDPGLSFGKLIKSNIARALKKQVLSIDSEHAQHICTLTSRLLSMEYCPRELEDYCKLVKRLGKDMAKNTIENSNAIDAKSMRLVSYLADNA